MRRALVLVPFLLSTKLYAEKLTWQQAVAEAKSNNSVLKSSNESIRASEAQIRVAQSANLPQLSANFAADYGKNSVDPTNELQDTYSATLSLSQSIFNGWQTDARVRQSRVNVSLAESTLQINKAQVSSDLKTAFANLIYAQQSIRLQESIVKRRKANLDLVELRFQNGAENKGSVLLSRAYESDAELRLYQARNGIDTARASLARALGRSPNNTLEVDENLPTVSIPQGLDLEKTAQETPQHRQAVLREESAESDITLARAGYFPSVAVNGSYGRRDTDPYLNNESWSVGLSLTVPIFQGGRDYYSTQSAIANRTVAAENREDVDRQQLVTLQQALARLEEAKRNVEVNRRFVEAAEMRSEIGRSRYNNGLISFDDWDLIESDLITRQQTSIQSIRDYALAEAAWENAIGKGSIP